MPQHHKLNRTLSSYFKETLSRNKIFLIIILSVFLASCSTNKIVNKEEVIDQTANTSSQQPVLWSKESVSLFNKATAKIHSDPNGAITLFQKVLKMEPTMEAAYFNLIKLYDETGSKLTKDQMLESQESIKLLIMTAESENVLSARILNIQAKIQRENGQFTESEKSLQKALTIEPSYYASLANMAILQDLYLHDLKTALSYYEQYQQQLKIQNMDDPRVINWLADIKQRIAKSEVSK